MATTLGVHLINESLPAQYKIKPGEPLNKTTLKALMIRIAREEPELYPEVVVALKKVGDMLATTEPNSPGLDDLESPAEAKAYLKNVDTKVRATHNFDKKVEILQDAQAKAADMVMKSTSNLANHVRSGGRGNKAQLMRMIFSPIAVEGASRGISPVTVQRSFSQGLTPGEYFASALEARQSNINSHLQVQRPGAVNKTFTSNLNTLLITEKDCGTKNGIIMDISDPHAIDRYLVDDTAGVPRNSVIDTNVIKRLTSKKINTIKVRSPMTCVSKDGVCAYCQGLLQNKHLGEIGTNVGVRAAQAMSEPLVQMALDAKHAARISANTGLRGLDGVSQLTKVPKNFLNKAIVAKATGIVDRVEPAAQGGFKVYINKIEHYVEPGFKVFVKPGDNVESGDILSEGIPSPKEIVEFKGLGAGRKYYVDAIHKVYANSGTDLDKRHLENLAKQTLNYVKIDKTDVDKNIFAGEIYQYNKIKDSLREHGHDVDTKSSEGMLLADEVLHYTVGSVISKSMISDLLKNKITKIKAIENNISVTPIMQSMEMTPLLNPDLLAKMGFRYLKKSFMTGVQQGAKSDLHGTSPWPGFMMGKEFGQGERGHY